MKTKSGEQIIGSQSWLRNNAFFKCEICSDDNEEDARFRADDVRIMDGELVCKNCVEFVLPGIVWDDLEDFAPFRDAT